MIMDFFFDKRNNHILLALKLQFVEQSVLGITKKD